MWRKNVIVNPEVLPPRLVKGTAAILPDFHGISTYSYSQSTSYSTSRYVAPSPTEVYLHETNTTIKLVPSHTGICGKKEAASTLGVPPPSPSTPTAAIYTNTTISRANNKPRTDTVDAKSTLKSKINPYPTPPRSESPSSSSKSTSRDHPVALPCKVKSYEGKNLGLKAIEYIKRGQLILKESPLLTIPVNDINEHLAFEHVYPRYSRLRKQQREAFKSLHKRTDERAEQDDWVNIVETNGIPLQGDPQEEPKSIGVFETICRINHSCSPNAGWTWYEEEQMLHLYAFADIPTGTEITASYLDDIMLSTSQRQERLLDGYGFKCLCSSCSRSHNQIIQSDKSLKMYTDQRDKLIPLSIEQFAKSLPRSLEILDLSLDILKQEKKHEEFGHIYHLFFQVYAAHGYTEEAKEHARRALAHYTTMWGVEKAAKYTEFIEFAKDPTRYEEWEVLLEDDQERPMKRRKWCAVEAKTRVSLICKRRGSFI